jgi:hypothetical protein
VPEKLSRVKPLFSRVKLQRAIGVDLPRRRVEIPTKSAMHSKTKPATNSELKPAGVPI